MCLLHISHRYSDLSAFLCFCLLSALWCLDALYTIDLDLGKFAWSDDFVVMVDLFSGCDGH